MTLASDQNTEPGNLSSTSRQMLALRAAVFAEWEKRVRESVKEAGALPQPVLMNTFPAFYDNIAEAITRDYPRTAAGTAVTSVGLEHGSERARVTGYDPRAIISEYQIFRQTIIQVLQQNKVHLNEEELLVINSSIDSAIKDAATAFVLAHSAFREQFVASLAHDLRNPLAAASTAAELMLHTTELAKIHRLAVQVTENLGRVDRMVRDLLDTVVFQSGERMQLNPSRFDMLELAREVCEQFKGIHGDRFEVLGKAVEGWWARDAVKRALENLMDNAVKYGATGTPIRIKIDSAYGRVMVTVHNQGRAIPPEHTESIFQVFRRAVAARESRQQGWGIGLPYARSVAESHGGSIGVDSSEERGTSFLIDIPIDSRPFQHAPTLENPP